MNYYYPYYSARAELPSSYVELSERLAILKEQERFNNLASNEANIRHIQQLRQLELSNYRNLSVNAELQKIKQEQLLKDQLNTQLYLRNAEAIDRQDNYLHKINQLKRERQLLDRLSKPIIRSSLLKSDDHFEKPGYMTDDQLIQFYESGSKLKQYQRELNARADDNIKQNIKHRQLQKPQALAQSRQVDIAPSKPSNNPNESNKLKEDMFKRSYIDDLRYSHNKGSNQKESNVKAKHSKLRGETIDVVARSQQQSPVTNKYCKNTKSFYNNQTKRGKATNNKKKYSLHHQTYRAQRSRNISFTTATMTEAMKRIQNRLKVSSMVYKDSKLRNNRHEADHLFNTFENQLKSRKEIKNKINGHPETLKKHNMVVNS